MVHYEVTTSRLCAANEQGWFHCQHIFDTDATLLGWGNSSVLHSIAPGAEFHSLMLQSFEG